MRGNQGHGWMGMMGANLPWKCISLHETVCVIPLLLFLSKEDQYMLSCRHPNSVLFIRPRYQFSRDSQTAYSAICSLHVATFNRINFLHPPQVRKPKFLVFIIIVYLLPDQHPSWRQSSWPKEPDRHYASGDGPDIC